jgi:hypothetical protein
MKTVNSNGDQETKIYTYLSRRSLMKVIGSSTFGMGLWMYGCDSRSADTVPTMDVKKESKMESIAGQKRLLEISNTWENQSKGRKQ